MEVIYCLETDMLGTFWNPGADSGTQCFNFSFFVTVRWSLI